MKRRADKLYVYDIVGCCAKIEGYIDGVSEKDFESNSMLQDALVRNIEIIGEAAKNLSQDLRESHADINWRDIMRMRDKITHHYFRIDLDIVWKTVTDDIPELKPKIESILEALSEE